MREPRGIVSDGAWLTQQPEARESLRRLRHDLAHPPLTCTWQELHAFWTFDHYRFVCAKPGGLEDYPELPVRLRGAFGRALHELPELRSPSGLHRPHPYDVFFGPLHMPGQQDEIARPFVIRAFISGAGLTVDLHIFGDAMAWGSQAAAAMTMALANGVAPHPRSRANVPIEVLDVVRRRVNMPAPRSSANYASLTFRSPVSVRAGASLSANPKAILKACLRRVRAMAKWQDVQLEPDDGPLMKEVAGLRCTTDEMTPYMWQRHSRRQGDTPIPMSGWLGRLIVTGDISCVLPALQLAETCNTGSHAALGLGWFELSIT